MNREGTQELSTQHSKHGNWHSHVLAGRSLREIENREDEIMHIVLLGWAGMLVVTLLATVVLFRKE